MNSEPILPIAIVPLEGSKEQELRREDLPDLRHWQSCSTQGAMCGDNSTTLSKILRLHLDGLA